MRSNVKLIGITKLFYYNNGLRAVGGGSPDPAENPTHLAWRVMISGGRASDGLGTAWMTFVDAHDGTVLHSLDISREQVPEMEYDISTANNTDSDGCWDLPGEVAPVTWFTEDGATAAYPGGDADAEQASSSAHRIYDYFYTSFDRRSYDNDDEPIEDVIHVGADWRNACYSHRCDHFRFGDHYTVLDTMAHEYTHGIDASKDDGGLNYEGQSGALDESFADVFAELVEFYATGAANWLHGSDLPNGYNRSLANPPDRDQPDHILAGQSI
jgi:Zn-dependent metalloprotease